MHCLNMHLYRSNKKVTFLENKISYSAVWILPNKEVRRFFWKSRSNPKIVKCINKWERTYELKHGNKNKNSEDDYVDNLLTTNPDTALFFFLKD